MLAPAPEWGLEGIESSEDELRPLVARAKAQAWLDGDRKRPLARPPRVVGLVSGERSRTRADVMGSLRDAGIKAQVVKEAASMQWRDGVEEIRSALGTLNARGDVDVIVIARGGGSKGDLSVFSDWSLAEAIAGPRAPAVAEIGHRERETLADRAYYPSLSNQRSPAGEGGSLGRSKV